MKKKLTLIKEVFFITICLSFTMVTNGQTEENKWNIGLHAGFSQLNGGVGNDFYKGDISMNDLNYLGSISLSRYLTSHLDVRLTGSKGRVGYNGPNGTFNSGITSLLADFRFNLFGPKSFVRPYVFIGGGAILFDKNLAISSKTVDVIAPDGGVGLNICLSPYVILNIQEAYLYSNNNKRDGIIASSNDAYLFHTIGLTFNSGKKKDADNDGVSDSKDNCSNTPVGVAVDKLGCPFDKDKDGISDYMDACPYDSGSAATKGCPDKDGDGIADKDDRCPNYFGTTAFKGCPDTDNDGIADIDDRCPFVAGSFEMKGCPDKDYDAVADIDDLCPNTKKGYKVDAGGCPLDNDKDGIVNEEDHCPNQAGTASLKGCPDSDSDGVSDLDDRCPTVKGNIANKGCPEISREYIKKITQIGSKVFFENNSDKLKVASLVQLDELSSILKKYETANLIIEGYTDSNGDDVRNMELSQKRTESVKTYLMGKGIMESRLTATGFGQEKPIADNKTSIGRAKNRRVELRTSY